ncbi:helix-hairpin-helix domain-containing protein [Embleya sp. NPDC005575]|uniref:helix-hairpin-helix domain-containing protein n=1 Tax=Embleya sp. NPDC005575 TaxID=3156892 RepID=UPI0033AB6C2D
MNGDGSHGGAEDAAEDRAVSPSEPPGKARVEAGPEDREDRSGAPTAEGGPEDGSAASTRAQGRVEAGPEVHSERSSEAQVENTTVARPEDGSGPADDAGVAVSTEARPEAVGEARAGARPEGGSGVSGDARVEAGARGRSEGRPRGEGESRSAAAGTSRTIEPASSLAQAGSTSVPDSRPKPDPVALLRDQLARLERGEAPTVVGGVAHIDAPRPDGAERARRRTALAAEAAEAAAAAALAAEAATRGEANQASAAHESEPHEESAALASRPVLDIELPPSAANESTALATSGDADPTSAADAEGVSVAAPGPGVESSALATEDVATPTSTSASDTESFGTPNPDSESTALDAPEVANPTSPAIGDAESEAVPNQDAESPALASSAAATTGGSAPHAETESTALADRNRADESVEPNVESSALDAPSGTASTPEGAPNESGALADSMAAGTSPNRNPASGALDVSPGTEPTSEGVAGESGARVDSIAAGTSSDRDVESGALGGVLPRDAEPGAESESGALNGERRQAAGRAQSHVGPASDNAAATPGSPISPRIGTGTGGGGWTGPGLEVSPATPAMSAVPSATPPDQPRRPFAAVVADVARLLTAAGAPERMAPQVATALGSEAAELLAADPWTLLAVPGIAPQQADLLARGALGAGWTADDRRRVRAIVLWLLRRAARQGDTAIEADAARAALAHFEVSDPDTALRAILAEGCVMAFAAAPAGPSEDNGDVDEVGESDHDFEADFEDEVEEPDELAAVGGVLLALDDYALAEEAIAEAVVRLLSTVEPWPETGDTKLDRALSTNGVLLYAAGPGEEPPAAVLTVAAHAGEAGLRVAVVAPTIDGRDRLGAGTVGLRELAAMERGPDGTLELDLLVVTDATLLDVTAAAAIFEAVPDGARLLLVGDPAGLESTGPGRVFTDLAATGTIRALVAPTVPEGPLEALADGIRDGRLPPIQDPERRAVLIPARTGEEAAHRCAQLVADSIPRAIGIAARDVLVVAPLATGPAGATALNVALKARLNPSPESGPEDGSSARRDHGGTAAIDVGDRVIRATPDPSSGVVQGVVRDALPDGRVVVAFGAAAPEAIHRAELRHGWALTARQSLGIRRPGAVVVLPSEGADAYTRALMYTLVTRGEHHVSIVHAAGPALATAVAADPTRRRTTHLQQAMREAMN